MDIKPLPPGVTEELHQNTVDLLRETVGILQQELEKYRAKSEETARQLSSLIHLVKRSRAGDISADEAIARLIDLPERESVLPNERGNHRTKAVLSEFSPKKSRAIHNWLHLTTRLMAAECARLEDLVQRERSAHFESRALCLDDSPAQRQPQMVDTLRVIEKYTAADKGQSFQVKSRPRSGKLIKGRPLSSQPRLLSAKSSSECHHGSSVTDLTIEPEVRHRLQTRESSTAMPRAKSTQAATHLAGFDSDEKDEEYTTYDDPSRYVQMDVYDPAGILKKAARPISASTLKEADTKRSRSRSSTQTTSAAKGRPLKYETTRMVPTKQASLPNGRPESAATKAVADKQSAEKADSICKPLNGIQAFKRDVARMTDMEKEFKEATLSLQQRLGIMVDGTVA